MFSFGQNKNAQKGNENVLKGNVFCACTCLLNKHAKCVHMCQCDSLSLFVVIYLAAVGAAQISNKRLELHLALHVLVVMINVQDHRRIGEHIRHA